MRGVRGDAISELDTASLWDYVAMIRPLKMNELKLSELKPSVFKRSAAGATKTSESSALLADNVADRVQRSGKPASTRVLTVTTSAIDLLEKASASLILLKFLRGRALPR